MKATFNRAIPVLPAADVAASLAWWRDMCGFEEVFRDATPPNYVGIRREEAQLHICGMDDLALARTIGDQTMVRFTVSGIDTLFAEFQKCGAVHPNGTLETKPWGTREFSAIDPNGVCITFQDS